MQLLLALPTTSKQERQWWKKKSEQESHKLTTVSRCFHSLCFSCYARQLKLLKKKQLKNKRWIPRKLLVERKVSLSASSSPSSSQSGKLGEDTRQTFFFLERSASAALSFRVAALSRSVSPALRQPTKPTKRLSFSSGAERSGPSLLVLASLAVNSQRWNLLKLRRKTANRPEPSQPKSLSLSLNKFSR